MSVERRTNQSLMVGLKAAGVIATLTVTADSLNYYWGDHPDDPLRRQEAVLNQQEKDLKAQIAESRDARENAIRREQIAIIERDLRRISHEQVEQMGPILARTRALGVLPGLPVSLGMIAYAAPWVIREALVRIGSGLRGQLSS